MNNFDDSAQKAGRALIESAANIDLPELAEIKTTRRRRSGIAAATTAFAATLVVVGIAAITNGTGTPSGTDAAAPPSTDPVVTSQPAPPATAQDATPADLGGFALAIPPAWSVADQTLTPSRSNPLELVSLATFPLSAEHGICEPFPRQAVVDFPADGAFVTLRERFGNAATVSADRPARFGPEAPPYVLPEGDCLDNTSRGDIGTMRWFEFTDNSRHFELLVVIGTEATAATSDEAWQIVNSLVVEPGVEAPTLTVDEVLAGNMFIIDTGTGPQVCGAVLESLPPQCSGPSLYGFAWDDVPWAESAQGVTWAEIYAEVRIIGGQLELASAPTQQRTIEVTDPVFPPPPPALDIHTVVDEIKAIKVNEWPAGIHRVISFYPDEAGGFVGLTALIVTDEGRRWLDERFGPGAVRATGSLRPLDEIVRAER